MKILTFVIVAVVVVLVWLLYPIILACVVPDMAERGQSGDLYGGLNTLFSGMAFAALIYTVILQSEELKLQRKELEQTREQIRRTAEANESAAKAMAEQVDNQLMAARISGLTTLLTIYNTSLSGTTLHLGGTKTDLLGARDQCLKELNFILTNLNARRRP